MKAKLRGLRDANGVPIFLRSMADKTTYELDGAEVMFPKNGGFDATSALMIVGQAKEAVYSIRQDITYKVLEEAVIQDDNGDIIFNLAQQDMVALRCVMRMGWQLPNPVNRIQPVAANRYPFGVLTPEP
jgi:HK97 family phage major capsid protein